MAFDVQTSPFYKENRTMKILIWAITGILLLMWTGFIAATTSVITWVSGMSLDPAKAGVERLANVPVPEWVSIWIPPGVLESFNVSTAGIFESAMAAMSWLTPLLGWINPLLWVAWGLMTVVLLVVAVVLHMLVGRNNNRSNGALPPNQRA